jgi:hypothetical protein
MPLYRPSDCTLYEEMGSIDAVTQLLMEQTMQRISIEVLVEDAIC